MSYKWNFYGLDKQLDINEYVVGEWEDILDCTILFQTYHNDQYKKYTVSNENFYIIIYYEIEHDLSLLCIRFDDLITFNLLSSWFEEKNGIVIWPCRFDTMCKLQILDSVTLAQSEMHNFNEVDPEQDNVVEDDFARDRWFETRIIFKNDKDYMLNKYSISISGSDCSKIYKRYLKLVDSKSLLKPYENCLTDYIYKQTGMQIQKLPVRLIILTNFLTINNKEIITQRLDHISFNNDNIIKTVYQQLRKVYSS